MSIKKVRLYLRDLYESGFHDHPQKYFEKALSDAGYKIIDAIGHSLGDCWIIEIDGDGQIPELFTDITHIK